MTGQRNPESDAESERRVIPENADWRNAGRDRAEKEAVRQMDRRPVRCNGRRRVLHAADSIKHERTAELPE